MNRTIANDLTIEKDMQNSNNTFHSQGTIIGTGGMNIASDNGVKLNQTQTINAVGPAVYEDTWYNTAKNILTNYNSEEKKINYEWIKGDPVRPATSPNNPLDFIGGAWSAINGGMEKHTFSTNKEYDGYLTDRKEVAPQTYINRDIRLNGKSSNSYKFINDLRNRNNGTASNR